MRCYSIKTLSIILLLLPQLVYASYTRYSDRKDVRQYISDLANKHKMNYAELLGLFRDINPQLKALESISKPAERVLTWKDYRPIFITDSRVENGVKYWDEHQVLLSKAEKEFGVPPEIIVAILGVESKYGRITGSYPVLDVLVTLGFDFKPRAKFFRSELEHFLLLARDEQFNLWDVQGSYAGAMGMPQFISSSYRSYAVDFDQDGRKDLWSNNADAIGSIANYFKRHGWRANKSIASKAKVKGDIRSIAVGRGRSGLKPKTTVQAYAKLGVMPEDKLDQKSSATLLHFEGEAGDEYWLGLRNFYVITRYNHSSMYALAVYQLSQEIKIKRNQQH